MSGRSSLLVSSLGLLVGAAVLGAPAFSTAAFTASTSNAASTVSAAADWTPPTVAIADPGSPVKGTVALSATASDGESLIATVVIQYQLPDAAAWTTVCTDTTAPYSCAWSTAGLADGNYDVRAIATDAAGYSTASAPARTLVANNVLVVLAAPADVVRATVPLSASIVNGGTAAYSMRIEYAPAGTTTWKTLCTISASPYTCSWVTTGYANDFVDLRAVATSGGTSHTSAVVADILVDNLAPVATMVDPGSPLSGFVTLAATATDAHSGVAQVVIQSAPTGSTTWTSRCTVTAAPYSCRIDSAALADGGYSFRAIVTDAAGNSTTSATIANRIVDNTVSSVSVVDPGAYLQGTVSVSANASSTAGITSVTIQRSPSGAGTWTDICVDSASPYACSWTTTGVADGTYDLRAVLVDGAGRTTTSAIVAARQVDNTPLRGYDVQAVNGGTTLGRLESGDTLTLTYNDAVSLGTVTSGWTGSALAVTLRLQDGNLLGLGNAGDTIDVLRSGSAVALGSVAVRNDVIKSSRTVSFASTMTASTAVVNGRTVTVVSIRLGASSGGGLRTTSLTGAMIWTPSGSVTDAFGNRASTAPTTELGTLDRDF
ncbi:Ig-like domain-containing protein [Yonghaparkia sp. Soil809]|uniref:Ig-like domain-containing protein n=1 Tax=Yonghaparkia sp. Soil809 TaxID=1736417 RepID=UPI0006F7FFB1|nr:Ig-like domain-containing protein [Yonghaparkia sp. Soil809]KRF32794.1 signal peptidase I [Yonghaparkia sp. Soil809]